MYNTVIVSSHEMFSKINKYVYIMCKFDKLFEACAAVELFIGICFRFRSRLFPDRTSLHQSSSLRVAVFAQQPSK